MGLYKNLSQNWDRTLQLDLSDKVNWVFGTRCKKERSNPPKEMK
ncbi:hypothetical protein LBBP_00618 [Leptospira borgpetersenii serovar Ballum]|uniref:Uncharacterized protein n=1 Tax=Leptospira borgpetersenii serovar Ballum TaxID=280505 RepID=A0A0S2IMY2_LEPBO|nr:hypothetical protein LBBP_00618 [Leptospira borgpetersenii serovar Ballum]